MQVTEKSAAVIFKEYVSTIIHSNPTPELISLAERESSYPVEEEEKRIVYVRSAGKIISGQVTSFHECLTLPQERCVICGVPYCKVHGAKWPVL